MQLEEITILLPCHSLEDFPVYLEGDEADDLLATWSAPWHPSLLAAAGGTPKWHRADEPPDQLAGRLIFIPKASEPLIPAGWHERAKNEGAVVIRNLPDRGAMVRAAIEKSLDKPPQVDDALTGDFLALGFSFLMVELLTRQMRYMSNLDEVHFTAEALKAAESATGGQAEQAREHLRKCFDVLAEARERFYPVDCYLLDLTLVAATTIGASLRGELAGTTPINLLLSGEVLQQMAAHEPSTLEALHHALEQNRAALVGGEFSECELPLLSPEAILRELKAGRETYERHLGRSPKIFGRRRFGLTPVLPQILNRFGFGGAIHFTLDDGKFPRGDQCRTRWEGIDSSAVDVFARLPLDANKGTSFLSFPSKMGESMDLDHVATVALAHWPGVNRPWYDDLRRASVYAPVFGKFVTVDDYFNETDTAGRLSKFKADQYRAPYLTQSVARGEPDALSHRADRARRDADLEIVQTLTTLRCLIRGEPEHAASAESDELEPATRRQLDSAVAGLADALPQDEQAERTAVFVPNPLGFRRHVLVDISGLAHLPAVEEHVVAVQQDDSRSVAVVEVPAMGYAWVESARNAASQRPSRRSRSAKDKPLAEENLLRNDFFEVSIDPETGGIRGLWPYHERGNRLSQQIALRRPGPAPKPGELWRDPDEQALYSVMAADRIEVTSTGPALGEIQSRGRLLDRDGRRLADFRQTLQVWRRSRVVLLDIELDVAEPPDDDPWNSYYAARFAWSDFGAELRRDVAWSVQTSEAKRIEAPSFVEIADASRRTAILSGGLPFHRLVSSRMLDTILVVRGESRRRFRLGIGCDLPNPVQSALEMVCPKLEVLRRASPSASQRSGWFFHLDATGAVATHWEPLVEEKSVQGFRLRVLETLGRAGRVKLRTFRPVASARQVDLQGNTLAELSLEKDSIVIDLTAYEWAQIEALWKNS